LYTTIKYKDKAAKTTRPLTRDRLVVLKKIVVYKRWSLTGAGLSRESL
jgi:hypothetical protein